MFEKEALDNVDEFQRVFDLVKEDAEWAKKRLEIDDWEIEINAKNKAVAGFCLVPDPYTIICTATKEVGEDKTITIKKQAKLADNHVYVQELGEYLALARVYSEIMEGGE